MDLVNEQNAFAQDVARLLQFIYAKGFLVTLGEAYRTPEQAAIYAKEGIGTKNSLHCKRLAIDLNLFTPKGEYLKDAEHYKEFGDYWCSLNSINQWGGKFKSLVDANHFERRNVVQGKF